MKIKDLINEAESLPVEERAMIIDKKWANPAQRRMEEIRSGTVTAVPGEQVFEKIWKSFEK